MFVIMNRLARGFVLAGGLVLSVLIVLTCLSILGRALNGILHAQTAQALMPGIANTLLSLGIGPIPGDFELVEAGMAFAIFAFLPLCQLQAAHADVDIVTATLPHRLQLMLRAVVEVLFAAVLVLIAWQLYLGTLSKAETGQTTFLLQFPLWWAYALSLTGAVASAIVAVYVAAMRMIEAATGQALLPGQSEQNL